MGNAAFVLNEYKMGILLYSHFPMMETFFFFFG